MGRIVRCHFDHGDFQADLVPGVHEQKALATAYCPQEQQVLERFHVSPDARIGGAICFAF